MPSAVNLSEVHYTIVCYGALHAGKYSTVLWTCSALQLIASQCTEVFCFGRVLLSALVKRLKVSRMQDLFCINKKTTWSLRTVKWHYTALHMTTPNCN